MTASGHERLTLPAATSAITLNADIPCAAQSDVTGQLRKSGLPRIAHTSNWSAVTNFEQS